MDSQREGVQVRIRIESLEIVIQQLFISGNNYILYVFRVAVCELLPVLTPESALHSKASTTNLYFTP